ncbi:sigma-70 family RNA polymerase sigma factor [Virgisporangium ochraceum]|uniref:RNA polymerase sigma factor n=1 Tax=Virgisporangium ochraceum TaxID=65505 RepID=A0A8J3ZSW1_9ACTN|nr:sigma-70 family RNA polymerase sigma factor [Virgisporangium ochraceum]GIJ66905.1 RNA polymerase sigma factor [Virgisporangium ochraceum]
MTDEDLLARRFEADRPRLRAVAHRMLGSAAEADDAVQEAWLRLRRVDADTVDNLSGWLTTVVGRVCLDMLRSRTVRKEDPLDGTRANTAEATPDPAHAAELADSVGVALLVVLETLTPVERLAFVLHDLFAVPFEEIAPIVGRSPAAARQLASRARRRVQSDPSDGARPPAAPGAARTRRVVEAFLAASRGGDFGTLLTMLDPDVVLRVDAAGQRLGAPAEVRGRDAVARFFDGRARAARPALVDGAPGAVVLAGDTPRIVITFIVVDGTVIGVEAVADADAIRGLDLDVT